MSRVAYAVPQQGFRPATNPLGALRGFGLRGLGDDSSYDGSWMMNDSSPAPSSVTINDTGNPTVTSGAPWSEDSGGGVYDSVQTGSYSIFEAALPWLLGVGFLLWVKKK